MNDLPVESLPQPAPEAPAPVRKPVEEWAQLKGHGTVTVTVQLKKRKGTRSRTKLAGNAWKFAAAKALHNWPRGRELAEAEYDAAIARAEGMEVS